MEHYDKSEEEIEIQKQSEYAIMDEIRNLISKHAQVSKKVGTDFTKVEESIENLLYKLNWTKDNVFWTDEWWSSYPVYLPSWARKGNISL